MAHSWSIMHKVLKSLGCDYTYQDTPIDLRKPKPSKQIPEATTKVTAAHPAYNCKNLKELKEAMQNFTGCALKETALNTVFSDGNPCSDVMLVGEAPGADEDTQGLQIKFKRHRF